MKTFMIIVIFFISTGADASRADETDTLPYTLPQPIREVTPIPADVISSKTIRISQHGGNGTFSVEELGQSISSLQPGTNIIFGPGEFTIREPIVLENLKDISITGTMGTTFVGAHSPPKPQLKQRQCNDSPNDCHWPGRGHWKAAYPEFDGFAIFKLKKSDKISFSNFKIQNSWPNGIGIYDSTITKVERVEFEGGTNAIFAMGPATEGVEIKHSRWTQDKELWSQRSWHHVHHGTENYLNGAFFQSRDIKGGVHIEKNTVNDAFNGIRIKVTSKHCKAGGPCDLNQNVKIIDNKFNRISDNVIEPEAYAENWDVIRNDVVDTHAAFSFDGVHGKNFRMIGNTVRITTKPRTQIPAEITASMAEDEKDPHNGGCIFKLKHRGQIENFVIQGNSFSENYTPPGKRGKKFNKGNFPEGTIFINNTVEGNFRKIPPQLL